VARVCKSVLRVSTHEIAFEECIVGKSFVRDFTVWNSSEMPLDFELSYKVFRGYFNGIILEGCERAGSRIF
jgi:hypothetical protein